MLKKSVYLLYFILISLFISFCIQIINNYLYWEDISTSLSKVSNPYSLKSSTYTLKSAFHLHSDELILSPQRHSISDIFEIYKNYKYDLIVISDYNLISKYNNDNVSIPSFEWGMNIRKRHLLAIGSDNVPPYFFFYSPFIENIQYTITAIKSNNSFVVINHPKLNNAFSEDELLKLNNYDAIEIFSPNGDDVGLWDNLLNKNKRVFCMATDDLHFFPEEIIVKLEQNFLKSIFQYLHLQRLRDGESLKRYILLKLNSINRDEIIKELNNGNFFCAVKFRREFHDMPVPELYFDKESITLNSKSKYSKIYIIGNNKKILKKIDDSMNFKYEVPKDYKGYLRIEFWDFSGVVYSNPIWIE